MVDSAKQSISSPSEKEMVEAKVRSRLQRSYHRQVQRVLCESHEGVLTLRGRVSSYYLKQIVQTLVLGMDGVVELNNRVEVVGPLCRRGSQMGTWPDASQVVDDLHRRVFGGNG
jgi:osmotically-inducible protein OsmY